MSKNIKRSGNNIRNLLLLAAAVFSDVIMQYKWKLVIRHICVWFVVDESRQNK